MSEIKKITNKLGKTIENSKQAVVNSMKKKSKKTRNSNDKETRLLDNAYKLFTEKGIKDTSIQEIVDAADVGKGTFYLYFKDKYEIQDVLIAKKSHKLFSDAIIDLKQKNIKNLDDQVIFIINYVIDKLIENPTLLKFISKNLSWGVFNKTVSKIYNDSENEEKGIYQLFLKGIKDNNLNIENPDVVLYTIIELVSSTCFNSILYKEPIPIEEYKPYLYKTIRHLINDN
jgi:AcrR family transcriptional regulator